MLLIYVCALVVAVSGAVQRCCAPSKYSAVMLQVGGSHKSGTSEAKIEDVSIITFLWFGFILLVCLLLFVQRLLVWHEFFTSFFFNLLYISDCYAIIPCESPNFASNMQK